MIFPFRSTFAIKYSSTRTGCRSQDAGAMNGYVFLAAIFATPLFGLMVDQARPPRRVHGVGTLLLLAVFPMLALHER